MDFKGWYVSTHKDGDKWIARAEKEGLSLVTPRAHNSPGDAQTAIRNQIIKIEAKAQVKK